MHRTTQRLQRFMHGSDGCYEVSQAPGASSSSAKRGFSFVPWLSFVPRSSSPNKGLTCSGSTAFEDAEDIAAIGGDSSEAAACLSELVTSESVFIGSVL